MSQCFLIQTQPPAQAPWGEKLGGAEIGTAEGKVRAAAGQTEPALFPPQHQGCSLGRAPPLELSQQAHGACCSIYTGAFPPQGSWGFANMRDHSLP